MPKGTAVKEKAYSEETVKGAAELLDKLPEKPKNREYNGYNAVKELYPKISKLRRNGYTYEDISAVLKEANIDLSTLTLKRYFKEIERELNGIEKGKKEIKNITQEDKKIKNKNENEEFLSKITQQEEQNQRLGTNTRRRRRK